MNKESSNLSNKFNNLGYQDGSFICLNWSDLKSLDTIFTLFKGCDPYEYSANLYSLLTELAHKHNSNFIQIITISDNQLFIFKLISP